MRTRNGARATAAEFGWLLTEARAGRLHSDTGCSQATDDALEAVAVAAPSEQQAAAEAARATFARSH